MAPKTVLITGCSSGFGKLTAKTFATAGWNVVATMRNPSREAELTALPGVFVTELDVCVPTQIDRAVSASLERFGSLDVLVNNAGFGGSALFEETTDAATRAMFETNVFGLMNLTRAVLPSMRRQGSGRVINVTSANGFLGGPTIAAYCSTKFAVEGFTESLAHEYGPLNILAKTVQPGAFPTHFGSNTQSQLAPEAGSLNAYTQSLRQRFGGAVGGLRRPEEPANDPQMVADKIYMCATTDTPIHNPVGCDAERLADWITSMPRNAFMERITELLFPEGWEEAGRAHRTSGQAS